MFLLVIRDESDWISSGVITCPHSVGAPRGVLAFLSSLGCCASLFFSVLSSLGCCALLFLASCPHFVVAHRCFPAFCPHLVVAHCCF